MKSDIFDIAEELNELYEMQYELLHPLVVDIIKNNCKNSWTIEHTLDLLLDLPTEKGEELLMNLCYYYKNINEESANFYIDSYIEQYKNEREERKFNL